MQKLSFYKLALILLPLFLAACNSASTKEDAATSHFVGQDFFLQLNVWYEKPMKIVSTNYHKGIMLKVGDKFKISDVSGKKILFSDENGVEYAILHQRKHSPFSLSELFGRYFSKESVMSSGGAFSKFTADEQKNIRSGIITKGMSKNAVLMAYGYPPEHRTPSLEGDRWIYWGNRWISKAATFKDGKLVSYQ